MRLQKDAKVEDELVVRDGAILTRQGERGREFIVIVDGSADVCRNGRTINQLTAGDFLGEIALISEAQRTATVTSTAESLLLVLTDRAFRRVVEQVPSVQASVLKALAERLQADAL